MTTRSALLKSFLGLAAVGIMLGGVRSAAALPSPEVRVSADGFIYESSVGVVGPFDVQSSGTGPVQTNVEAGVVFNYRYPGHYPDYELEATMYANGKARADYGTNGASVQLNLRPTNGTDRGTNPAGNFSGSLPYNSTLEPHADASSSWKDTFVINGGTGTGTATVNVALHGTVRSGYGANGTIWYDAEPAFQLFGTSGHGTAHYNLDINYDVLPTGLDPEYSNPIRWEKDFLSPLEASDIDEVLTGSFIFEYGVPFALSSFLDLSGYEQISMDFYETAILSLFDLPEGADLTSGSGHIYPTGLPAPEPTPVPEPSTLLLLGSGLIVAACLKRNHLYSFF